MNKKIRAFAGFLLILLSVVLMIFWEAEGRKMFMNQDVIVSVRDINAGEECKSEDLIVKSIPKDDVISKGINPKNYKNYLGKKFKYDINSNSQISKNAFVDEKIKVSEGMSIFRLKSEWIFNLSNSIRKGDTVTIYSYDRINKPIALGEYYVAFVKDNTGREVVESTGFSEPRILERTNGLTVPSYVEIVAQLSDYSRITSETSKGNVLILTQKEVSLYE